MNALLNSRKHLYIMATGLCLAVLVGGWFLLISPKKAQVAAVQTEVTTQESANDGLRSQVQALQALQAKLPQQQASLARMQSKVPKDAALPELLRVLNKTATDSGVKLIGVTPTAPAAVTAANGVSGVDVTLKVSGTYVALEQYELALEALPRAFLVGGMTIASGTTSQAPGAAATDALSATINGRVFLQSAPSGSATPPSTATTSG
jgi:Tfp pilus assembly protein PilO